MEILIQWLLFLIDLENINNTLLLIVTGAKLCYLIPDFYFWIKNRTDRIGILLS